MRTDVPENTFGRSCVGDQPSGMIYYAYMLISARYLNVDKDKLWL